MPFLAEIKAPVMVSSDLIKACKDGLDAIRLCMQLSNLSQEYIADQLGIDPGHMTRMLQGRANFPDKKRKALMLLCGNYAPVQYDAYSLNLDLRVKDKEEEIRELRTKLAMLGAA